MYFCQYQFFMKKAELTRHTILIKGFGLIYSKGYNSSSIDEIINTTGVTKGAFYYHFKNKQEMGIAIINEIIKPKMETIFITPLERLENPTNDIYQIINALLFKDSFLKVEYGCPLSNLAQEMSHNEAFSRAIKEVLIEWETAIGESINLGIKRGAINKNVNSEQVAKFIISGYWGVRNLGKIYGSTGYKIFLKELKNYLNGLKTSLNS